MLQVASGKSKCLGIKFLFIARPRIAVTLRNGNREANIAVTHPRRIMHNSSGKFELVGYKLVNETEAKGMCLGTVASNFEVNPPQRTLALPLQADKMSGKLMVAAKYGDGRLVFSKPCEVSLPVYGKSGKIYIHQFYVPIQISQGKVI